MKQFFVLAAKTLSVLCIAAIMLLSCNKEASAETGALDKDTSYAFGMFLASQINEMGFRNLVFDYEAFKEGFAAFNGAQETRITMDEAMTKLDAVYNAAMAKNNEELTQQGLKNQEDGKAYMAENGARSGVSTTASGLQYEVISEGSGEKPSSSDTVRVHYEGTLIDGTVFDSSYERGEPVEFPLNGVIPGWTEGLQLMNTGGKYRLVIPSELGYGPGGAGPIPPSSTLIFTVELLSIVK